MSASDSLPEKMSRRRATGLLGAGAGLGLLAALTPEGLGAVGGQAAATSAGKLAFPKGAVIRTMLKDLPPEALASGATLFHEHLSYTSPFPYLPQPKVPPPPHFTSKLDLMVNEVRAAGKDGVTCIVDAGTRDLGRSIENLRAIANRSGVHIVASGGLYTQPGYPPDVARKNEDQLADDFVGDAKAEGWGAFGEMGSSLEMHPEERKVFIAVSKAHLRTNLPIFTHTPHEGCPKCGMEQLDILESHGVNPRIVCIGHLSDIKDDPKAETQKAIAKRGAFIGFDTLGQRSGQPDSKKIEMLLSVLDAGYEDQVLLSSDFYIEADLKSNWGSGYSTVLTSCVPKLRYAGVKEATIHKMLMDNPRRFLAFVPRA